MSVSILKPSSALHTLRSSWRWPCRSSLPMRTCSFPYLSTLLTTPVAPVIQNRRVTKFVREAFRAEETQAEAARQLDRFNRRDWRSGDVYAPHDLSAAEARKWSKRYSPTSDAFDALDLNPLDLYKNFSIMSEYMTEMGRIRHSSSTGLRPVNQRKIAKAIRRAVALGLMPSVHRHPEILRRDADEQFVKSGGR